MTRLGRQLIEARAKERKQLLMALSDFMEGPEEGSRLHNWANPTTLPPWMAADLMLCALEAYERTVIGSRSTAAWAPPGHQGKAGGYEPEDES